MTRSRSLGTLRDPTSWARNEKRASSSGRWQEMVAERPGGGACGVQDG